MNEIEHLLVVLMEEAAEVQQAAAKALRFGLDDGYPGTARTNRDDLYKELTQLGAVRKMLADRGVFPRQTCRDTFEEKERKVTEFMAYACERGTLLPNAELSHAGPDGANCKPKRDPGVALQ